MLNFFNFYNAHFFKEAKRSIQFYQNLCESNRNDGLLELELDKIRNAISQTNVNTNHRASLKLSHFTAKPARKALLIGIVLVSLNQFSGVSTMLIYTANIFQESGSSLSPNKSAIVVGVIQAIGSVTATNLVDRAGRKVSAYF